jgi:hypothetical protein
LSVGSLQSGKGNLREALSSTIGYYETLLIYYSEKRKKRKLKNILSVRGDIKMIIPQFMRDPGVK